jgi:hypothetical protein
MIDSIFPNRLRGDVLEVQVRVFYHSDDIGLEVELQVGEQGAADSLKGELDGDGMGGWRGGLGR